MGIGDEIMAAGQAERAAREAATVACIVNQSGALRWSEVWDGNPYVARELTDLRIVNAAGARPYIRYPFTVQDGITFTEWRARDNRGHIYLSGAERAMRDELVRGAGLTAVAPYVVIEPNVKSPNPNPNKQWALERYQEVVDRLGEVTSAVPVQLGARAALRGMRLIPTATFRVACAVLAGARAYIGTEGALHHAAAAFKVPAVVIFGGSPSVNATGYPEHANLGGVDPCGQWLPCAHCAAAMVAITVDDVLEGLRCQLSR